jgi:hypothetical protein
MMEMQLILPAILQRVCLRYTDDEAAVAPPGFVLGVRDGIVVRGAGPGQGV